MLLNKKKLEKLINFCQKIPEEGSIIWQDKKGHYEIFRGEKILDACTTGKTFHEVYISDFLKDTIVSSRLFKKSDTSGSVLSIGTFDTHNKARHFCTTHNFELITTPLPLANDSFGTNRIGVENSPSLEGKYPCSTILDIELARNLPFSANLLGMGEFIGLYTSVIDFFLTRAETPPKNLLNFICELIWNLEKSFNKNQETFIMSLSTALLFKILIMRISTDYQIGCGADHIIANYLEKNHGMPHGKAVYTGVLFLLLIYPEWENFGLFFSELENLGIATGIISNNDLKLVTALDVFSLVTNAIKIRPFRSTLLNKITSDKTLIDTTSYRLKQYRKEKGWETFN